MNKKRFCLLAIVLGVWLACTSFCFAQRDADALKELEGVYVAVNFINQVKESLPDLAIDSEQLRQDFEKPLSRTKMRILDKDDIKLKEKSLETKIKEFLKKSEEKKELSNPNFGILNVIVTLGASEKEGVYTTTTKATLLRKGKTWSADLQTPLIAKGKKPARQIRLATKGLAIMFLKDYKSVN